jgi:hypothetical protein
MENPSKLKNDIQKTLLVNVIEKTGIDSGFFWTIINRFFSLLKGPLSAFIIVFCLSPYEQGIWYTFASLGALTVFAELGFTQIILQFVSQEYAFLSFNNRIINGEPDKLDKFFSLIRYSVKFYLFIVPLAIFILSIAGIYLLSNEQLKIIIAWLIYSVTGGVTLIISLFQSIYTGLNEVAKVQKTILVNSIFSFIITNGLLLIGVGIFSLSFGWIASNIISLILLYLLCPCFWKQIFFYKINNYYFWKSEIIPLQWKYAIGFVSAYFVYQLYVPIVYKTDGNILSGQLGLTLVLIGIMRSVSDTFFSANYPKLNILVARKDEKNMYHKFVHIALCAFIINILAGLSIILFTKVIHNFPIGTRFLNLNLTICLVLFNIPINIIGILGLYTQLHKDASLYPLGILAGVIGIVAMFILYQYLSLNAVFLFLVIIYWCLLLPINIIMFFIKRRKYLLGK